MIYLSLAGKLKKHQQVNIKAWLNLGGLLKGSPVIDHYQKWPQSWSFFVVTWYKGWDKEKIFSMSVKSSRNRFERLNGIDENIIVINYIGLSLSGQISNHGRVMYPLLISEGPNDGFSLLPDIIAPNSLTIIAPSSDHFFAEDPKINDKTVALMKVIILYLEKTITTESTTIDSAVGNKLPLKISQFFRVNPAFPH